MNDRVRRAMAVGALAFVLTTGVAYGASVPVEPSGVDPQMFPSAETCSCHASLVDEWKASMHAQALADPLYQTKLAQGQKETDGTIGAFCNTCHGPAATITGQMASGTAPDGGAGESVGCMFCHQVTGLAEGPLGNASQLVTPDGTRRAQIEVPQAPHPAAYSELHKSAEVCGGCHNVNHPVNGMHLESTYAEWKDSSYGKSGVVCQDCHMSASPGTVTGPSSGQAASGAPQRDDIYQMNFVGAQVGQGNASAATALLKSAAAIEIDAPDVMPGSEASATVTVKNVGAGHYLPTGLTEVRQMWLEITLEDEDGESTTLAERRFGTVLRDDEGNHPAELWNAAGIESDDRIPPDGSATETVTVGLPEGTGHAKLVATLYYQSASDEFASKAGVTNPTTMMASAEKDLYASDEARLAAEPSDDAAAPGAGGGVWYAVAAGAVLVLAGVLVLVFRRRGARA